MCHSARFCTVFLDKVLYPLDAFFTNLSFHNQVHRHLFSLLLPHSTLFPTPLLHYLPNRYSVTPLSLKSFHTYGGVIRISMCLTPRCQSASTTADIIMPLCAACNPSIQQNFFQSPGYIVSSWPSSHSSPTGSVGRLLVTES